MKKFNKVIAIMMMMSITFAMPAMAGNKSNHHNGKNDKAVVVNNHKSESHFDKVDKALSHHDAHKTHAYRPDVKTTTIKVSRHDSHKKSHFFFCKSIHCQGWQNNQQQQCNLYNCIRPKVID